MIADKLSKMLSSKRWIVFKSVDSLIAKPVYCSNRNITNNSRFVKKLLCTKNSISANTITRLLYGENVHAYKIMSNSTAYSNFMSPTLSITPEDLKIDSIDSLIEKQWISMSTKEILENFKLLSHYAYQNSEDFNHLKYKGIFDILSEKCSEFSDEELIQLLDLLQFWQNSDISTNNLWMSLDKTCIDRLPRLTTKQIFVISDYMYKMNVIHISSFIYHGMRKLDAKQMTPANLVQYAFLMKVKGPIVGLRINQFEFSVRQNADSFTVEEWSVICMAFFKYQTAIQSRDLLVKILQKVQSDIDNVTDISLTCILKALRYSADLNMMLEMNALLKTLESQVEGRNLMSLTHMALLQATLLVENPQLTEKIMTKFSSELENARIKDIERLIFALYTFNYNPETTPFYGIASEEMKKTCRKYEIEKFTKPFLYTVLYMLKVNYFPEEIVKKIMSPEFIKRFSHNDISTMDREYLDISYCLQIDHPEYEGHKLRKDQLRYLLKKFGVFQKGTTRKFQKLDHAGRLMIDVAHHFKLVLGSESAIHVDYPLPYCNRHFIFLCYDPETRSYLPPAKPLEQIPLGEIKYAPKDGKRWAVVIPAAHNILTRNSNQPTGILAMQMRHLQRIGYETIMINHSMWKQRHPTNKKKEFITQILDDLQTRASWV